jgi:hypothetical protein
MDSNLQNLQMHVGMLMSLSPQETGSASSSSSLPDASPSVNKYIENATLAQCHKDIHGRFCIYAEVGHFRN